MTEQKIIDGIAATPRPYHGTLGPTGQAPLVPTGIEVKRGVLVQWATGTAWVGGTGVSTGMGYQLGPSGALADGAFQEVFLPVKNVRSVSICAPAGVVRWTAF